VRRFSKLKNQLALLEQLQEVDMQIDRYQSDLDRFPLELQEIARQLVVLRREISEAKERVDVVEKDLRKKEQDLAVEQEKIKRSERRLLGIKNQKEYNALSREVKLGKKVVGELEDIILASMTELEGLKRTIDRKDTEYQQFEKSLHEKKAEAEAATKEATDALVTLTLKRDEISQSIDRDYLKRYHTVKKVRGNAIAEMQNGICTACHMAIPPQLNIRVLKQEEMIICPTCNRILYVKPENIPEYNKLGA
jgi:uncharacterized protein